jgi:hypothetical protein
LITRQNSIDNRKELFLNFIFAAVAFYFIFSAVFDIPFYHHDIYKYSTGSWHRSCMGNQGHKLIIAFGRPITAYLDCVNNKIGNTLESINILRALCLGLISIMVSFFAAFLKQLGFSRWSAFLVSATVFLLPLTFATVIMACSSLYVSMLLAYFSYFFISKLDVEKLELHFNNLLPALLGLFLLIASFFTYPAVTSFYLVPTLTLVLFKPLAEWSKTKKIVFINLFIYSAFSILYFIAAKQLQDFMNVGIPAAYKIRVNTHFLTKIDYLFLALPRLWNMDAGRVQAYLVYGVMTLGCLCGLKSFYKNSEKITKSLVQAVVSVFIYLLFASAVYLAAPATDMPSTRVIFAFQAMIALILFWSANYICKLSPHKKSQTFLGVAMFLFVIAGFFANQMVTRSVLNDYLELNVIVNALAERIKTNTPIKRVHIVGSVSSNFTAFNPHEDIFNVNSSVSGDDATSMVNAAFLRLAVRHTFDLTNCSSKSINGKASQEEIDCIHATPDENIVVTYSRPGDEIYRSPDMLIISMTTPSIPWGKIDFRGSQPQSKAAN